MWLDVRYAVNGNAITDRHNRVDTRSNAANGMGHLAQPWAQLTTELRMP